MGLSQPMPFPFLPHSAPSLPRAGLSHSWALAEGALADLIPGETGAGGAVGHECTGLSFHGCFMEDL